MQMVDGDKITILWYGDSPAVRTGFGRVSYEFLKRLHATGKYIIYALGINDKGDDCPIKRLPNFTVIPCPDLQNDPYGIRQLPQVLQQVQPDIVISLNDIWVWIGDERYGQRDHWLWRNMRQHSPKSRWIGYFPIDGRPLDEEWIQMMHMMHKAITYSKYGVQVIKDQSPDMDIRRIYHGVDCETFKPVGEDMKNDIRKQMNVPDDAFLIGCVSRNQPRKNIPRLLHIFKLFNEGYGKCVQCGYFRQLDEMRCELCGEEEIVDIVEGKHDAMLYLHMNLMDSRGYNIPKVMRDFKMRKNVVYRPDHNIAHGVSEEELNHLYNAMDVHLLPSLAEGFGLPVLEAMAAGTPNIVTRSTSMTEMIEQGGGFAVRPNDYLVLNDTNHCRKHLIDIGGSLEALETYYNNRGLLKEHGEKGVAFAKTRDWDTLAKQFDDVVAEALSERKMLSKTFTQGKGQRILFVWSTADAGDALSITGLVNALDKSNAYEFAVALPKEYHEVFDGNKAISNVIDIRDLIVDRVDGGTYIIQLDDAIPKYFNAVSPYIDKNRMKILMDACGFGRGKAKPTDYKPKYYVSKDEKKWAKSWLKENGLAGKPVIAVCTHGYDVSCQWDIDNWKKLCNTISKKHDIGIVGFTGNEELDDYLVRLDKVTLRQQVAILNECGALLAVDNPLLLFASALKVPTVGIFGPTDPEVETFDLPEESIMITGEKFALCSPCWKPFGSPCRVTGTQVSSCMSQLRVGDVYGRIRKLLFKVSPTKKVVTND